MPTQYTPRQIANFWKKVEKSGDCWTWTACRNPHGYGLISITNSTMRRPVMAHRMSYEINVGPIPDGLVVCHHCDTPSCVRPDHLFLGTQRDNLRDMATKGRAHAPGLQGSQVGTAKLDEERVRLIRRLYADGHHSMYELADMFGVKYVTIWTVVRRTSWKHVDERDHAKPPN